MRPFADYIDHHGGPSALSRASGLSRQIIHSYAKTAYVDDAGWIYIPSACKAEFEPPGWWTQYQGQEPIVPVLNWQTLVRGWLRRDAVINPYTCRIYVKTVHKKRLTPIPT